MLTFDCTARERKPRKNADCCFIAGMCTFPLDNQNIKLIFQNVKYNLQNVVNYFKIVA